MGRITKGILGGFSGTVGTVIGGNWKGIEYMRSQPARRTATSSLRQKQQQLKFGMMIRFLTTMAGFLGISFKSFAVKMTGINSALSYNLRNAITGIYPNYEIDYSLVLVSRGDLPNALNPSAAYAGGGIINFNWTDNAGTGKALDTDVALAVVYCEARNQCIYFQSGERGAGIDTINVSGFSGEIVQTWLGFISADGREVATSLYTGELSLVN